VVRHVILEFHLQIVKSTRDSRAPGYDMGLCNTRQTQTGGDVFTFYVVLNLSFISIKFFDSAIIYQSVISTWPAPAAILTKITVAAGPKVLLSDLLATKLTLHLPSFVTLVIFFWFVTIDAISWFILHNTPLSLTTEQPPQDAFVLYRAFLADNAPPYEKVTGLVCCSIHPS
jgi:hypothetical protein